MAGKTKIEWTGATWNPVRGCTRASEGCRNCYAERVAARFSGPGQPFEGFAGRPRAGSKWTGKVEVMWDKLDEPLGWRKPQFIFVNSMSDLFHEDIDQDDIAIIFGHMIAAHHLRGHILQVLTKRSDRMHRIMLHSEEFWDLANGIADTLVMERVDPLDRRRDDARATLGAYGPDNPPAGIWLGVSVEDQATADLRIPHLLETPAAVRFVSCEPLLGPVDLTAIRCPYGCLPPDYCTACYPDGRDPTGTFDALNNGGIDWVIAGGESGPGARPLHPDWARSIRDQCQAAGVAYFHKQNGEWLPGGFDDPGDGSPAIFHPDEEAIVLPDRRTGYEVKWIGGKEFARVGKKAAGRLLDGREWNEVPGERVRP